MLPTEVFENSDLLDLTLLKTAILMDPRIPNNFKSQVDDLLFEYSHFLAIKVIYKDTGKPVDSSPSWIIQQVWGLHVTRLLANYIKCCNALGCPVIDYDDPSESTVTLEEQQKNLEMAKNRYSVYFPNMLPNEFWEDYIQAELTVHNQTPSNTHIKVETTSKGSNVKEQPTSHAQVEPTSNVKEEPTSHIQEELTPNVKEEPIAHIQVESTSNVKGEPTSNIQVEPGFETMKMRTESKGVKGSITVRSDLMEKDVKNTNKLKTIPTEVTGGQVSGQNTDEKTNKKDNYSTLNMDENKLSGSEIIPTSETNVSLQTVDFTTYNLNSILQENLKRCGYAVPTAIQKKCLPLILADRDVMACSPACSGKTAAYLLPIIHKLMGSIEQCLVITATKELTLQIEDEVRKLSAGSSIRECAIDGEISQEQYDMIKGYDILIATPESFLQLVANLNFQVENLKFIVLDEADQLLGADSHPHIEDMLRKGNQDDRQTLMFSRTFSDQTLRSGGALLSDYEFVMVPDPQNNTLDRAKDSAVVPDAAKILTDLPSWLALAAGKSVSVSGDQHQHVEQNLSSAPKRKLTDSDENENKYLKKTDERQNTGQETSFSPTKDSNEQEELRKMENESDVAKILMDLPVSVKVDQHQDVEQNLSSAPKRKLTDNDENENKYLKKTYERQNTVQETSFSPTKDSNEEEELGKMENESDVAKILMDLPVSVKVEQHQDMEQKLASAPKRKLTDNDENENNYIKKTDERKNTVQETSLSPTKDKSGKIEKETTDSMESKRDDTKGDLNGQIEKESGSRDIEKNKRYKKQNRTDLGNERGSDKDSKQKTNHFDLPPSKQNDCYWYIYDKCYHGPCCPYRHEPKASNSKVVCKFWKKGNCKKKRCSFRHFEKMKKCNYERRFIFCDIQECIFRHDNARPFISWSM